MRVSAIALYEAVIVSILAALKQSDNPGMVNPRPAAQAVSAHTDSTQEHTRQRAHPTCRRRLFCNANTVFKMLFICKGYLMVICPSYRYIQCVLILLE